MGHAASKPPKLNYFLQKKEENNGSASHHT